MLVIPGRICIPVVHEDVFLADVYRASAGRASVELLRDGEGEPQLVSLECLPFDARAPGGQAV